MALKLTMLYRGPLEACNYGCGYCPFAHRQASAAELSADRQALERFCRHVEGMHQDCLAIFFTPRGEALIHAWYQDAVADLSHLPQVRKVAVQTNLSCDLDWLTRCRLDRLGLWSTYHPGQAGRAEFLAQCRRLDELGVRYSVGMVGVREHFDEIEAMRAELDPGVYLWVNAYKSAGEGYYRPGEVERLLEVDGLFELSLRPQPSAGRSCRCGRTVVAVDGDGTVRRCHFVAGPLGNIYDAPIATLLTDQPCPNDLCRCHIGYIHMPQSRGQELFGDGMLERVPATDGLSLAPNG